MYVCSYTCRNGGCQTDALTQQQSLSDLFAISLAIHATATAVRFGSQHLSRAFAPAELVSYMSMQTIHHQAYKPA